MDLLLRATDLVLQAGQLINAYFYSHTQTPQFEKADHTLVTDADLKANDLLVNGLRSSFPEHAILSEETGLTGNLDSEWVWLVDPLDGTKAFAKKTPGFSVMVGLLKNEKPILGLVFDPVEKFLYRAFREQGCFLTRYSEEFKVLAEPKRLCVSQRRQFTEMPLIISTGFPEGDFEKIQSRLSFPLRPPINSVGIKVGLLVRQVGDCYINHHPVHYWDTCAPQMILEEAGGCFTDLNGNPLVYSLSEHTYQHSRSTLASNGWQHLELVQELRQIQLSFACA